MTNDQPSTDQTTSNIVVLPAPAPEPKPSEKVIAFVKRHPLITVAGGLAIGAATGLLLSRTARSKVAPPKLASKATHLIEAAGASSLIWGKQAGQAVQDASNTSLDKLEKFGKAAAIAAGTFSRLSAKKANRLSEVAADAAQRVGSVAADSSAKIVHIAEDVREKVKSRN